MLETIKANLKAFSGTDWLVLVASAIVFSLLLDGFFGVVVGAVAGYLLIINLRKDSLRRRSENLPQPPPSDRKV